MIDLKGLPWFLIIPEFGLTITSPTIPTSISDNKKIIYSEVPVIGKNYKQKIGVRNENRILTMTLPIINRKTLAGNSNILQAFELLRNSDTPSISNLLSSFSGSQLFQRVPQVIYSWGTHSTPMYYFVNNVSFEHKSDMTNIAGFSQFTNVTLELELDEDSLLYKMSTISRRVQAIAGLAEMTGNMTMGRPY